MPSKKVEKKIAAAFSAMSDEEKRVNSWGEGPLTMSDGKSAEDWINESKEMSSAAGIREAGWPFNAQNVDGPNAFNPHQMELEV